VQAGPRPPYPRVMSATALLTLLAASVGLIQALGGGWGTADIPAIGPLPAAR